MASASSSVRSHEGADSRNRRQVRSIRGVYDYALYKSIFYLPTYIHAYCHDLTNQFTIYSPTSHVTN